MMLRNILNITLFVLVMTGLATLFGFASRHQQLTKSDDVDIRIKSISGNFFIHNEDIRKIISEQVDSIENIIITPERLTTMYDLISSDPFVASTSVYRTIKGRLGIEITLRDPIVRVVNRENQSFYIDRNGYMFPLSGQHTARVMIATGHVTAPFVPGAHVTDTLAGGKADHHLVGLYELVRFIDSEPFWRAFIDHVYVDANGKYELTPRNAVHIIQFGKAERIEQKFRKLQSFYTGNLAQKGWYHYRRINLEFNNQVVCIK